MTRSAINFDIDLAMEHGNKLLPKNDLKRKGYKERKKIIEN